MSKENYNKNPSESALTKKVAEIYGISDDEKLKSKMRYELKQYKRNKRQFDGDVVVIDSGDEEWDENVDRSAKKKVSLGKCRKSFADYSAEYRRDMTDEILQTISSFMEERIDVGVEKKTLTQFLAYLIHRVNYQNDKKTAEIGMNIFRDQQFQKPTFDENDAIALMHELTLTKYQMIKLKAYLTSKGVYFPNQRNLLVTRKKLHPPILSELDGHGVSVSYTQLFETTTKSLIETINSKNVIDMCKEIKAVYKDGGDGSGSQTIWKSASMINASDHVFQYSMVPLRLEQDGTTIWKNPSPNSATSTRPIFLLRAGESEERVKNLVIKATDEGRKEMEEVKMIDTHDGLTYAVKHEIVDSMKDLKLKKEWSGLGGADCILCDSRKKDWMNIDKIKEGFSISRLAEDTKALWQQLAVDGEISRESNDYAIRKGLTNQPLTDSDQHHVCVTHSYINVMSWFLKVLYRSNISYESWVEKSTVLGEPIRRAKVRVQDKLRLVGLIVDQVSGANSKTGTTNDGNTARDFFSETHADEIVDCVEGKYKEVIQRLHKNISVILRLMSSTEQIDCEKYSTFCKETSLIIAVELPWVEQNYTLHGALAHSAELMYLNNGWSIGMFSEEPLESNNKFIRRYLERYARLTNPNLQLTDVMSRLLERSHPSVIAKQKQILLNTLRTCELCKGNHKTVNHDKYSSQMKRTCLGEYDSLVEDFILNNA